MLRPTTKPVKVVRPVRPSVPTPCTGRGTMWGLAPESPTNSHIWFIVSEIHHRPQTPPKLLITLLYLIQKCHFCLIGNQKVPSANVPIWYKDHFELKANENQKMEKCLPQASLI